MFSLQIKILHQGASYEEVVKEEEDPKKKSKTPVGEPEVRTVTPNPIPMENESGREF